MSRPHALPCPCRVAGAECGAGPQGDPRMLGVPLVGWSLTRFGGWDAVVAYIYIYYNMYICIYIYIITINHIYIYINIYDITCISAYHSNLKCMSQIYASLTSKVLVRGSCQMLTGVTRSPGVFEIYRIIQNRHVFCIAAWEWTEYTVPQYIHGYCSSSWFHIIHMYSWLGKCPVFLD